MSWFDKILPPGLKRSNSTSRAKQVPEGLWVKCPACDAVLYSTELEKNLNVCPKCEHHMRLRARLRLERLLDTENRKELGQDVRPVDALKFKDSRKYTDRLSQAASASGETDALVVMEGTLEGLPVVAACFEFDFMGGSMGSVVGERFARGVERALEKRCPFISIAASDPDIFSDIAPEKLTAAQLSAGKALADVAVYVLHASEGWIVVIEYGLPELVLLLLRKDAVLAHIGKQHLRQPAIYFILKIHIPFPFLLR